MKRKGRSEKIFWVISLIVVVSMVGSTVLLILESVRPPKGPEPSGWLSPSGRAEIVAEAPVWSDAYCLADPAGNPV